MLRAYQNVRPSLEQEQLTKAVCWHGKEDVRVDTVPNPTILNPRDAII
nr:hypothetical protein [cf. Phormidesmis sp. LEGE 11477]